MEHRKIAAGRGPAWLNESIALIGRQPGGLVGAAVLFSLLSTLPQLLGPLGLPLMLAYLLLWPALMGGIVLGMREADAGRPVAPMVLFAGFGQRLAAFLPLCLPLLGVIVVVVLFAGSQIDVEGLRRFMEMSQANPQPSQAEAAEMLALLQVGGLFRLMLLAIVLALASFSLTFLAIPLVMLRGVPGFAALGLSLRALMSNLGAWLLYLLVGFVAVVIVGIALGVGGLVLMLVLSVLGPVGQVLGSLLMGMVLNVLMTVVVAASQYLAWKDVFGEPPAGAEPPPPRETIAAL